MDFFEVKTGPDDSGKRLDKVLRSYISSQALSNIYSLIRKGLVKVNQKKTEAGYRIQDGDVIKLPEFIKNPVEKSIQPDSSENICEKNLTTGKKSENLYKKSETAVKLPFTIIYKDENLLIVEKPYDSLVHGGKDSMDRIVQDYFKQNSETSSLSFNPGPLHRLDRKTSGLLCFSWSLKGARWFSENIQTHSITKIYTGIVQGKLTQTEKWEDFIDQTNKKLKDNFYTVKISHNSDSEDSNLRKAITFVTPQSYGILNGTEYTVVQFKIITGRTHQIRSQSALHHFPLLGDTAYGGKKICATRDFFLHACELDFPENRLENLPESVKSSPEKFIKQFLKK